MSSIVWWIPTPYDETLIHVKVRSLCSTAFILSVVMWCWWLLLSARPREHVTVAWWWVNSVSLSGFDSWTWLRFFGLYADYTNNSYEVLHKSTQSEICFPSEIRQTQRAFRCNWQGMFAPIAIGPVYNLVCRNWRYTIFFTFIDTAVVLLTKL